MTRAGELLAVQAAVDGQQIRNVTGEDKIPSFLQVCLELWGSEGSIHMNT